MLHQIDIREKLQGFKGGVKNFWEKIHHKMDRKSSNQADGIVDVENADESDSNYAANSDIHEFTPDFTPDSRVATSPRTRTPLSDGSSDAQNLVWDNEDASMQDKSYSFDEDTTDADYEKEDDLNFEDDSSSDGGQESRYK
ncbi:MAG: hypothetical protein H0V66_10645 [Bdellovibrionales bacterium]|nr:hypothetical protein [Bdellovibrionales bacterium]